MQYLLLQEFDASHGGGTAPSVVVPETQRTTAEVISKYLSICYYMYNFVNACVSIDYLLKCLIFTIFEVAGTPLRT